LISDKNNSTLERDPLRWWEWEDFWLSPVVSEFLSYLESVRNKRLVFLDADGKVRIFPYTIRFSRDYQRKLLLFSSIISAVNGLKKVWNKVLTYLRRKYPNLDFFTSLEFSFKRGHGTCHLHILLRHVPHIDLVVR